jgi:hypothetical protein
MARLVHYDDSLTTDRFGDTLRNPYDFHDSNPQQGDNFTIATEYTTGVPAPEPANPPNPNGRTEAEILASQYRRSSSPRPRSTIDANSNDDVANNRLTYIDEDYNYYPSTPLPAIDEDKQDAGLVHNAADVGRSGNYQDLEYAEPYGDGSNAVAEKPPLARFMDSAKYPIDQRIEDKKRGIGRQRYPFLSMFFWSLHAN